MTPRLSLCLLALLLPAPVPAPRPPRTDWGSCRSLSRNVSRLLEKLEGQHGFLKDIRLDEEATDGDWPPRIRCSDACDPPTLDTNNTRCLRRILQGLQHYRDLLDSDVFSGHRQPELRRALDRLLALVQQEHGRPPRRPLAPSPPWAQALLQHQALERLQSFTAVMGRVFSHGAR
ncbi:interleukin-23 subunit alpha [Eudromia elegans]